jgi:hypothetical protein
MPRVRDMAAEMLTDGVIEADETFQRIASAAFCEHPIRLMGTGHNKATGETRQTEKLVSCKTRRRSKCLACSQVYERDAYSVAASGWREGSAYAWITLTAPGAEVFGCQHHVWAGKKGKTRCTPKRKCPGCGKEVPSCKAFHRSGDPLIGVPVCDCFDYEKAAAYNAAVPKLWTATLGALNSAFPPTGGVEFDPDAEVFNIKPGRTSRLAYIKVAEWQQRGLVHLHVLIRDIADADKVREVVAGVEVEGHAWASSAYGVKVEIIKPGNASRAREAFSYLVKYSVKSVADHQAERSPVLAAHLARIRAAAPASCDCSEERRRSPDHASTCRVLRAHAEGLGYGGHLLTKSQQWGTSFLALRMARSAWSNSEDRGWEYTWAMQGRGYEWETNDQALFAAAFYRSIRERARAPVPWADRWLWLGTIQTDPFFVETVWADADGKARTRGLAA